MRFWREDERERSVLCFSKLKCRGKCRNGVKSVQIIGWKFVYITGGTAAWLGARRGLKEWACTAGLVGGAARIVPGPDFCKKKKNLFVAK